MNSKETGACSFFKKHKKNKEKEKLHFLTWYRPPLYDLEQAYNIHHIKLEGVNTMPPFNERNHG